MAYKAQYYPGKTSVALNRKKFMDPTYKLEKLRSLSDDDVVIMLGHRAPGSAYKTIHPPLKEGGEPDDPIRKIVEPTPGAAAGDRIRYNQFTDSMYLCALGTLPEVMGGRDQVQGSRPRYSVRQTDHRSP